MKTPLNRRNFLKTATATGVGLGLSASTSPLFSKNNPAAAMRVGVIGLDTSHSVAFTKVINNAEAGSPLADLQVVAAYPHGSKDIESSVSRIPEYTEEIQTYGVEIMDSIDALLDEVDVVLLETNDGRRHLEQAMQVYEAGKPVFIDKPIAASLPDTIALIEESKKYEVPMFTSSSLRYTENAQAVRNDNKIGKVLGADAYSPASLEKTHPDLYWYGIHGVEILYTAMGTGCKEVRRVQTADSEFVTGTWLDGRIGTFRGMRAGDHDYGGTAFGEEGNAPLGPYDGYKPLLLEIAKFFKTGKLPISHQESLEIYAFMSAADVSKWRNGEAVSLDEVINEARNEYERMKL